jgi:uncharacterized membrane protein
VTWNVVLVFMHLLAACVWVGGFVAIAVVARVARRELDTAARVAFFRSLGRSYAKVAASALAVGVVSGTALLGRRGWDQAAGAAALLALALIIATVAGIARQALVLRASIGTLTLALLGLGVVLAA